MEAFEKVITQVPALAVLAYIVWKFLQYLRAQEERLKSLSEGCHVVQRDAIVAIRENSRVLGGVTQVLDKMNGKKGGG